MLDPPRQAVVKKLKETRLEALDPHDRALVSENNTMDAGVLPKKLHFGSDYIYASNRDFAQTISRQGGRVAFPTFARGGFSNIWGAAALPTDACDMTDWPFARSDLDIYYRRVADLVPMLDGAGTLSSAFPLYHEAAGSVDPGPQGRALLADLEAAKDRLSARDTIYGHARLCVHTANQPYSKDRDCVSCGECFVVWATDLASRARVQLPFDAVFLAAGPINTTRILLRSASLYDRPIRFKESQ